MNSSAWYMENQLSTAEHSRATQIIFTINTDDLPKESMVFTTTGKPVEIINVQYTSQKLSVLNQQWLLWRSVSCTKE